MLHEAHVDARDGRELDVALRAHAVARRARRRRAGANRRFARLGFPNARAVARAAFGSELLALLSAPVGSGRGPPAAAVRSVTRSVKRAGV